MYKTSFSTVFLAALLSFFPSNSYGWYGKTHKWLAQVSVNYLPQEEREFFERYRHSLFEGTVKADNYSSLHHVYFSEKNGRRMAVDKSAALFAQKRAWEGIELIRGARGRGEVTEDERMTFAEKCGEVIHVICDMHAPHTVRYEGSVHEEIELEVNKDVRQEGDGFVSSDFVFRFDGTLRGVDPYTATLEAARLAHYGDRNMLPAEELIGSIPMGEDGTGAFVGGEDWDEEVDRTVRRNLDRVTNIAAEAAHWMHIRAFLDPIDISLSVEEDKEVVDSTVEGDRF